MEDEVNWCDYEGADEIDPNDGFPADESAAAASCFATVDGSVLPFSTVSPAPPGETGSVATAAPQTLAPGLYLTTFTAVEATTVSVSSFVTTATLATDQTLVITVLTVPSAVVEQSVASIVVTLQSNTDAPPSSPTPGLGGGVWPLAGNYQCLDPYDLHGWGLKETMVSYVQDFCRLTDGFYVTGKTGFAAGQFYEDIDPGCPIDAKLNIFVLSESCLGSINSTFCNDSFLSLIGMGGSDDPCNGACPSTFGVNATNDCLAFNIDFFLNARPCPMKLSGWGEFLVGREARRESVANFLPKKAVLCQHDREGSVCLHSEASTLIEGTEVTT